MLVCRIDEGKKLLKNDDFSLSHQSNAGIFFPQLFFTVFQKINRNQPQYLPKTKQTVLTACFVFFYILLHDCSLNPRKKQGVHNVQQLVSVLRLGSRNAAPRDANSASETAKCTRLFGISISMQSPSCTTKYYLQQQLPVIHVQWKRRDAPKNVHRLSAHSSLSSFIPARADVVLSISRIPVPFGPS